MPAHIERLVERLDEYRFALNDQAAKSFKPRSPYREGGGFLQPPITATYYSYLLQLPRQLSTISISYHRRDTTSDAREPAAL